MKDEKKIIEELKAKLPRMQPKITRTITAIHLHKKVFYQLEIEQIAKISAKYDKNFYVDIQQGFISIHRGG